MPEIGICISDKDQIMLIALELDRTFGMSALKLFEEAYISPQTYIARHVSYFSKIRVNLILSPCPIKLEKKMCFQSSYLFLSPQAPGSMQVLGPPSGTVSL